MVTREEFLSQLALEIHKPIRKNFPRLKVISHYPRQIFSIDLADMIEFLEWNNNYRYILTIVDVYSRYAWAVPVKSKSAADVLRAFLSIGVLPESIWADAGSEFKGVFGKKMKELGIKIYHTYSENKSVIVERFNRTLKTIMWKTLAAMNSHEWVSVLPDLVSEYNTRKHSSIGMTPTEKFNTEPAARREYTSDEKKAAIQRESKFKLGDHVRISKTKGIFGKGYTANWSLEIFTIDSIHYPIDTSQPITYNLIDYNREKISGKFYEQELQLAKYWDIYLVDKVLQRKKVRGKMKVLVSWVGWPSQYDSWVDESEIIEL